MSQSNTTNPFANFETFTKASQSFMDMGNMMQSTKQQTETMRQVTGVMTETFTQCFERGMEMLQSSMEQNIQAARDISSAQGIEDMVSKQSQCFQTNVKSTQEQSQELAQMVQEGTQKAFSMISEQANETFKNAQTQAENAAKAASKK